jgi:oligosaccharide reducing-end xylanase
MNTFPQRFAIALGLILALSGAAAPPPGAFATGRYPNLFRDLLGRTDAEVAAKIQAGWQQLFYGRDDDQRVYYPAGPDQAYIADVGSGEVRSEGMSYGMMIAVQLDRRAEFDRLWKWVRTHMHHATGPRQGYFAWQCAFDGRQLDPGSASDGEEWFAMALFFASHRWDAAGTAGYGADAQALLRAMLLGGDRRGGNITSLFDRTRKQVVFAPTGEASVFTDPSYHLPAFYELWARWAQEDRPFWSGAAATSREFLRRAADARTGLMPDFSDFDGTPRRSGGREDFRFDAWRTLGNVGLDYAWFAADPWQVEQSNRVLSFLAAQGPAYANQFALDGRPLSSDHSPGLAAMAAVAGLAADSKLARPFVQELWDAPVPTGKWRYYDGLLYFMALLEVSGRFQIYGPPAPP